MTVLDPVRRRIHDAALRLFAQRGTDRVTVRDLAAAAGVARGTIYNNVSSTDTLFEEIADQMVAEMHERIQVAFGATEDPAQRLSIGIRLLLLRAHDEPHWGRFICRFGQTSAQLKEIWYGQTMKDLVAGIECGRYNIQKDVLTTAMAMIIGSVLGACLLVVEGYRGWREAGMEVAQLILCALGVPFNEARAVTSLDLPSMPVEP
jgi:AcrR family transcriptional regulator